MTDLLPLALRARRASRLSQTAFAAAYRLELASIRNWEQGKRDPDRAAQVLLCLIEAHPVGMAKLIDGLPSIADSRNGERKQGR